MTNLHDTNYHIAPQHSINSQSSNVVLPNILHRLAIGIKARFVMLWELFHVYLKIASLPFMKGSIQTWQPKTDGHALSNSLDISSHQTTDPSKTIFPPHYQTKPTKTTSLQSLITWGHKQLCECAGLTAKCSPNKRKIISELQKLQSSTNVYQIRTAARTLTTTLLEQFSLLHQKGKLNAEQYHQLTTSTTRLNKVIARAALVKNQESQIAKLLDTLPEQKHKNLKQFVIPSSMSELFTLIRNDMVPIVVEEQQQEYHKTKMLVVSLKRDLLLCSIKKDCLRLEYGEEKNIPTNELNAIIKRQQILRKQLLEINVDDTNYILQNMLIVMKSMVEHPETMPPKEFIFRITLAAAFSVFDNETKRPGQLNGTLASPPFDLWQGNYQVNLIAKHVHKDRPVPKQLIDQLNKSRLEIVDMLFVRFLKTLLQYNAPLENIEQVQDWINTIKNTPITATIVQSMLK